MLIGYLRVSKSEAAFVGEQQREALLAAGIACERIYEDVGFGRHDARPGLIACLARLQVGNTLVLWRLDRFGRSLKHLVAAVEELRVRGVGLKVLAGAGAQIDTTSVTGWHAFSLFSVFSEFERELVKERVEAGRTTARARGRKGGRPRKMNKESLASAMAAMSNPEAKPSEVARSLGLTTTTLYAYVNGDGTPKAAGMAILNSAIPDSGLPAANKDQSKRSRGRVRIRKP
ncbi:recombinase family protein [Novosphingopyxis sp.]|uniref:recombinase family protein n=1 Tax=Novosphingopyxis sp. TaxID=2709690 RepID=UPI003B59FD25